MKIAVITCHSRYDTFIPHFDRFWQRFWPEQCYEIVSDRPYKNVGFAISCKHWSDVMIAYCRELKQRRCSQFIILMDDYILCARPQVDSIKACWDFMLPHNDVGYIRLDIFPPDVSYPAWDFLGKFSFSHNACLSLVEGIWNVDAMLDALYPGETAWQTEINGYKRARKVGRMWLGVRRPPTPIPHLNLATKGVIDPEQMRWIEAQLE